MKKQKEWGKQFVMHTTRVVSAAHCHNLRGQQSPTVPSRHLLQQEGVLLGSRQQAWHDLRWELYSILVVHKRDVCPQGSCFLL
jgi:hypothetical protein